MFRQQTRRAFLWPLTVANRCLLVWLSCLLVLFIGLSGCASTGPAPVVSRDVRYHVNENLKYYRVRHGDTLYSIAWRLGIHYRALAKWNRLGYPYTIHPGDRLRIKPALVKGTTTKKPPVVTKASKPKSTRNTSVNIARHSREEKPSSELKLHWQWPTKGKILQQYSSKDPTRKGIKIAGSFGQKVLAAETGRVVYGGSGLIGYGNLVIIKHSSEYLSAYGYNSKLLVKEGDQVTKGMPIAVIGSNSDGKLMLHFEIRYNGTPKDPLRLLPRR